MNSGFHEMRSILTIRATTSLSRMYTQLGIVGFEAFTAVVLKSIFFWDMTPCSALFLVSTFEFQIGFHVPFVYFPANNETVRGYVII
jgi:hypothetical protein